MTRRRGRQLKDVSRIQSRTREVSSNPGHSPESADSKNARGWGGNKRGKEGRKWFERDGARPLSFGGHTCELCASKLGSPVKFLDTGKGG